MKKNFFKLGFPPIGIIILTTIIITTVIIEPSAEPVIIAEPRNPLSLEQALSEFAEWINTIPDKPNIFMASDSDIIPIWELLESMGKYTQAEAAKEQFLNEYQRYLTEEKYRIDPVDFRKYLTEDFVTALENYSPQEFFEAYPFFLNVEKNRVVGFQYK